MGENCGTTVTEQTNKNKCTNFLKINSIFKRKQEVSSGIIESFQWNPECTYGHSGGEEPSSTTLSSAGRQEGTSRSKSKISSHMKMSTCKFLLAG